MKPYEEVSNEVAKDLQRFEKEVKKVYTQLVLPTWTGELHGLTGALYGYMMGVFSRIDLYSSYWQGSTSSKGQTHRMIQFMGSYFSSDTEANTVAVHLWRHKLMHTSRPRALNVDGQQLQYYWLLHWWEHLPAEKHYTFVQSGIKRKLNVGLIYLIQDLKRSTEKYFEDVASDLELQGKLASARVELDQYTISISI